MKGRRFVSGDGLLVLALVSLAPACAHNMNSGVGMDDASGEVGEDATPSTDSSSGGADADNAMKGDAGTVEAGSSSGGVSASDAEGGSCAAGFAECSGECVDLTKLSNCMTCGNACSTTIANARPTCTASGCSFACNDGYSLCAGACVQLATAANCGSCGTACTGAANVCAGAGGTYSCVSGCPAAAPMLCSGSCVDATSDANNCASCGHACTTSVANASAVCVNSACTFSCNTGYVRCNGACVQLTTSSNCGTCGNACSGSTPVCVGATALYSCASGCPAVAPMLCNGSCVEPMSDIGNCKTCGHVCTTSVANATATCNGSACGFTCNSGTTLCNGACVNFTNDANNCGGCGSGHACSGGTPVCSGSTCISGCPAATATLCGATCVDETRNPSDCGSCGNACSTSIANANAQCASSECTFACNSGTTLCNGACVNFTDDNNNCGGCGSAHVCGGGTPQCSNSMCVSASLSVSYQVQDSSPTSSYVGNEISINDASTTSVQISDLTVRYYYTDEVHMAPQMTINWSHVSTSGADQDLTVNYTFGPVAPAVSDADSYVQFSFSSSVSVLTPGESAVFSWQFNGPNPAADVYTQTNDYSFDATKTTLTAWNHIVLFESGSVEWGVVP